MVSNRLRRFVLLFWIPSTIAGGIITVEILLQVRSAATEELRELRRPEDHTRLDGLRAAYRPFTVQHLHPQYLFFFPLEPADRTALGNTVCSLDAEGFREPGPAAAAGRKLGVLLGGSSAFGHFASSNATTITSYLNQLQTEYFFVNAGVPSWNSTQEVMRMALQIAEMKPAIVMTYDGANDSALADFGLEAGRLRYPAGTPENFDQLEALVDEARHPWKRITWSRLFPELTNRIEKYSHVDEAGAPIDPAVVKGAAARYVNNLARISELAHAAGGRFIAIFQPVAGLHQHVSPDHYNPASFADMARFRDAAFAVKPEGLEMKDFSSIFDEDFDAVPVVDDDVQPDTIFVDAVHLNDRGNEMIARRLAGLITAAR